VIEAHLYTVLLDEVRDPGLLAAYHELLSVEEKARYDRYLVERARHQHVVAHALKRLVLSRRLGVDPASLDFVIGEHGKPELSSPACGLRFNLSHTDGLVALLVADDVELGVDVETVDRGTDTVAVADRFFATPEVAALHALPLHAQKQRFFEYWTLKESYLKAVGAGLHLPLGSFWFDFEPLRVTFAPPIVDDPARWWFFQDFLPPRWRLAAAVERRRGEPRLWVKGTEPPRP
jgi:4'-phosphopantetheinyl transferase